MIYYDSRFPIHIYVFWTNIVELTNSKEPWSPQWHIMGMPFKLWSLVKIICPSPNLRKLLWHKSLRNRRSGFTNEIAAMIKGKASLIHTRKGWHCISLDKKSIKHSTRKLVGSGRAQSFFVLTYISDLFFKAFVMNIISDPHESRREQSLESRRKQLTVNHHMGIL